jgi:hypothetical protein
MRKIWFTALFSLAMLAFVTPAQAGPFDIPDDSYVQYPRPCD